jgi:protein-disulfide isomerase
MILKTVRLRTFPEVMKKKVEHTNKVKIKRKEAPVVKHEAGRKSKNEQALHCKA